MPPPDPRLDHLLRDRTALVQQLRRDLFGVADDVPLHDPAKALRLTQALAWTLREEGWGLVAAKPGSTNNVDGFTTDVIAQRDGEHVDVVSDAEGHGGATWQPVRHRPEWNQSWNDAIAARWWSPVPPAVPAPEPTPDPPADPPAPPVPPSPPPLPPEIDARLRALEAAVEALGGQIAVMGQALDAKLDTVAAIAASDYVGDTRLGLQMRFRLVRQEHDHG